MEQAIKKTAPVKALSTQTAPETKTLKTSKTEEARLLNLKETNLFHRFLESSCDCV